MIKKGLTVLALSMFFLSFSILDANAGMWKQGNSNDPNAWWYDNGDGTFPVSTWMWIDGNEDGIAECYYFDETGKMLSDTVTPDGYTVDQYGAWTLGFVRRKYVMNPYQTEIFKDAAEGLLCLYEDELYGPPGNFIQPRYHIMYEDRQKLLSTLLAADTEKCLANGEQTVLFAPTRLENGSGYFAREKTLEAFETAFGIGLNLENLPQSDQGELIGRPRTEGIKYRITGCESDSDGSYLYMKLEYEKFDAKTNEILRTGTLYMELRRNSADKIGYTIDTISNSLMQG